MDDGDANRFLHAEALTQEGQRRRRERINWLVENAAGRTVLDVGCRHGITSILLGRKGFTCLAIDSATELIERSVTELKKEDPATRARVDFKVMDAREVAGGPYDTIVLGEVLEQDPDPPGLLDALLPQLSPGGRMLISVPYGYQPSAPNQRAVNIDTLVDLLTPRAHIHRLRVLNRFLVAIVTRESAGRDFLLDRGLLGSVEDVLSGVQREVYELKTKLEVKADEAERLRERLKAKSDEGRLVKEKLKAKAEEVRVLQARQQQKGDDVRSVMAKLGRRVRSKLKGGTGNTRE